MRLGWSCHLAFNQSKPLLYLYHNCTINCAISCTINCTIPGAWVILPPCLQTEQTFTIPVLSCTIHCIIPGAWVILPPRLQTEQTFTIPVLSCTIHCIIPGAWVILPPCLQTEHCLPEQTWRSWRSVQRQEGWPPPFLTPSKQTELNL